MAGGNADETLEEGLLANQEDEMGNEDLTERAELPSSDVAVRGS